MPPSLLSFEAHAFAATAYVSGPLSASVVAYPRLRARDAFVAIPCAVRDAPDAELRPERDDRVVSLPPYPVW